MRGRPAQGPLAGEKGVCLEAHESGEDAEGADRTAGGKAAGEGTLNKKEKEETSPWASTLEETRSLSKTPALGESREFGLHASRL